MNVDLRNQLKESQHGLIKPIQKRTIGLTALSTLIIIALIIVVIAFSVTSLRFKFVI